MKPCGVLRTALLAICLLTSLSFSSSAQERPFGGVGLQVVPTIGGELVVLNVLAESPAAAQMLPGDYIFKVDDFVLRGSDFGETVSKHLWGPIGSRVVLHYRRPGVVGDLSVVLERTTLDPRMTVTPTVSDGVVGQGSGRAAPETAQ
jgi:C-terminal processing protease CtpA/Prc